LFVDELKCDRTLAHIRTWQLPSRNGFQLCAERLPERFSLARDGTRVGIDLEFADSIPCCREDIDSRPDEPGIPDLCRWKSASPWPVGV
jgi:hypothetical protein